MSRRRDAESVLVSKLEAAWDRASAAERERDRLRLIHGAQSTEAYRIFEERLNQAEAALDAVRALCGTKDAYLVKRGAALSTARMTLTLTTDEVLAAAQPEPTPPDGAALIAAERQRVRKVEGFTPEADVRYTNGELLMAARAYLDADPAIWPESWRREMHKPSSRVRDLVKAGQFIAAEIDRQIAAEGL